MKLLLTGLAAALAVTTLTLPATGMAQGMTSDHASMNHRDNMRHDDHAMRHDGWNNGHRHHASNHRHQVCGWTWRHHHRERVCHWR